MRPSCHLCLKLFDLRKRKARVPCNVLQCKNAVLQHPFGRREHCFALAFALAARSGAVPHGIWLAKYVGTAAVTVTMITVLVFLGPALGYKSQLSGFGLWLHLIGPLLAIVSFCFFERLYPLPLPLALSGLLPVVLYGLVYLYKVVLCPEEKRWEDFYGYNKDGKWPIAFAAMMIGGALVCLLLRLLYRL